jgi:predicted dehydrogenase
VAVRLRGAISGFGAVAAQAHLPGWRSRSDLQIVAVHDPVSERRHLALRLIKNVRVYDDLELMLTGERLDFLDIASPPALHAQAARAALEAGAHVIVEKPLCLDPADFDSLASLAAAKSRVLMCVHNWKHSPAYRLAHEIVSSGRLGALRYVGFERSRTEPASGAGWRLDPKFGGGILIDHGWHVFYLMRWLMGGEPVDQVAAHLGFASDTAVDDTADLRVRFPRDRIAYCHLSWRAPQRRTIAILYGHQGVLEVLPDHIRLTDRSGRAEVFPVADPPDDSYHAAWFAAVAADFEAAIVPGGTEIARLNLAEARTALSLIVGARRSHQRAGAPVDMPA